MFLPLLLKTNAIKSTGHQETQLTAEKLEKISSNIMLKATPLHSDEKVEISIAESVKPRRFFPWEIALCTKTNSGNDHEEKLILSNSIGLSFLESENLINRFGISEWRFEFIRDVFDKEYDDYFTKFSSFEEDSVLSKENKDLLKGFDENADVHSEYVNIYNRCNENGLLSEILGNVPRSEYDKRSILEKDLFQNCFSRYLLHYPSISIDYNVFLTDFHFDYDRSHVLKPDSLFFIAIRLKFFYPHEIRDNEIKKIEEDGDFKLVRTNWLQVSSDGKLIKEVKTVSNAINTDSNAINTDSNAIDNTTQKESPMGTWVKVGILIISIVVFLVGLIIYKKISRDTTNSKIKKSPSVSLHRVAI